VLAAAGSGKTKTLIARIAHFLKQVALVFLL
jgi:superfamily I DNA/RNA helicase